MADTPAMSFDDFLAAQGAGSVFSDTSDANKSYEFVPTPDIHFDDARGRVVVWSDGSSRHNPGRGGYGAVVLFQDRAGANRREELSCGYARTTNNRMELLGVIAALEALPAGCEVEIHTDSQYVCNAFNQNWISGWKRRGWKNSKKEPVANKDLWLRLIDATDKHQVRFMWVKGHAGTALNERCDELATSAADGLLGPLLQDTGYTD